MPSLLAETLAPNPFAKGGRVLVESTVLSRIAEFRQLGAHDCEAGGVLIGYRRDPHIHIVELTVPQPKDKRSRFGFLRKDSRHQNRAIELWRDSGGTLDYVGEWHTHPEPFPSPSPLDQKEWGKILRRRDKEMVFMIAGTTKNWWLGVGLGRDLHEVSDEERLEYEVR